jgi:hypothetical protein
MNIGAHLHCFIFKTMKTGTEIESVFHPIQKQQMTNH